MNIRISSYAYSGHYGTHAEKVTIGPLTLYFSYQTVIAFQSPERGLVISENVWSRTTGKHLNAINSDKSVRVSREAFEQKLNEVLKAHGLDSESVSVTGA